MSYIKRISYGESKGKLKQIYDRIKGPQDYLDNILTVHSLRPHTLEGHMKLYKNVMHHDDNELPRWLLETIGIFVSMLNKCSYCVEHHFQGLCDLIKDDQKASAIRSALETRELGAVFDLQQCAILEYARIVTLKPWTVGKDEVESLRRVGLHDGQILEINQVAAYFAYANRTVLGLGVDTTGDILGFIHDE